MLKNQITMMKLRTIIRLYENKMGTKTISNMTGASRNTIKKYISQWRDMSICYSEFQSKSDAELFSLFNIHQHNRVNERMDDLQKRLPAISKNMKKKGMTSYKQWEE